MTDPCVGVGGESAEREGSRERRHGPRIGRAPQSLKDDDRDERPTNDAHDCTGPVVHPRHERLDRQQHGRRHENDRERRE